MPEFDWRPPPIRSPLITQDDLGPRAWRRLHELAELRGRAPRDQILPLLRYALAQDLAGRDVELSRSQLEALLRSVDPDPDLVVA